MAANRVPNVWVVSENNAGTINQALGVAEILTDRPVIKTVTRPKGLKKALSCIVQARQKRGRAGRHHLLRQDRRGFRESDEGRLWRPTDGGASPAAGQQP